MTVEPGGMKDVKLRWEGKSRRSKFQGSGESPHLLAHRMCRVSRNGSTDKLFELVGVCRRITCRRPRSATRTIHNARTRDRFSDGNHFMSRMSVLSFARLAQVVIVAVVATPPDAFDWADAASIAAHTLVTNARRFFLL